MPPASRPRPGGDLALSASLALLSYVPFPLVARAGLLLCAWLFVVDPLPPHSRLLALASTLGIALLARLHRAWHVGRETGVEEPAAAADSAPRGAGRAKDE